MNDMQIFQNEQFGSIRTVVQDGEPWFVAKDVCAALELDDTSKAVDRLDDDELTRIKFVSGGQNRDMYAVNEPGLYTLILGSRKPEAKAFKRWVTHEVLPAIRKTGRYATPGTMTNALAEMHTAMDLMQDLLADMKQLVPKRSSLDRALAARADGNLDAYHLGGHRSAARRLLDHEKIGRKITVYLIEEDISTEQLAAELGVSSNTVFRWRRGEHAPAGERLEKLCEVLGCQIEDLLR